VAEQPRSLNRRLDQQAGLGEHVEPTELKIPLHLIAVARDSLAASPRAPTDVDRAPGSGTATAAEPGGRLLELSSWRTPAVMSGATRSRSRRDWCRRSDDPCAPWPSSAAYKLRLSRAPSSLLWGFVPLHGPCSTCWTNAVRYSPGSRVVEVALCWCEPVVGLEIRDPLRLTTTTRAGCFERFYRGDPSGAASPTGGQAALVWRSCRQDRRSPRGRVRGRNHPGGGAVRGAGVPRGSRAGSAAAGSVPAAGQPAAQASSASGLSCSRSAAPLAVAERQPAS